ncbi:MAG TPA: hypothetical protein VKF42_06265, partial [Chitinivibrionales bacterium]|nr:hypothetical protein [Chitinivibrionales bacterium]
KNYLEIRQFDSAIAVITSFEESHPGDKRAEQFRQQIMVYAAQQQPRQPSAAAPGFAQPPSPKK